MSSSRFRKFFSAVVLTTAFATAIGFSVASGPANAAPVEYGAFCTVGGPAPTQTNLGSVYMWKLTGGTRLDSGQFCEWGRTKLVMQTNGNLQVLDELGNVGWSSATRGRGDHAIFQTDGNFVIYSSTNQAVWSSYTASSTSKFLAVQIDGNVVIYDGSWNVYWTTDTEHSGSGGIPPVATPTATPTETSTSAS
jgi:hypothetical protein